MKQKNVNVRLELDREIADLLGFAFEECGKKGIKHVVSEIKRISKGLLKEDLKAK